MKFLVIKFSLSNPPTEPPSLRIKSTGPFFGDANLLNFVSENVSLPCLKYADGSIIYEKHVA